MNRLSASLLCVAFLLAGSAPRAGTVTPRTTPQTQPQPPAPSPPTRTFDLPSSGDAPDQSLAPRESNEWRADLAPSEMLVVSIEVVNTRSADAWPQITAIGPDGATIFETTDPTISPNIDRWSRTIVAFITESAGSYRLRVAARSSPVRYQLRLETRRVAMDQDRQRLAAYALWHEGMRLIEDGAPDSLRAAIEKYSASLPILESIEDDEGQAMTHGTIAGIYYGLSDSVKGKAAAEKALEIWKRLGREREEAMTLSDLGLLAFLGYDHASAGAYYEQALARSRALDDRTSIAATLTRIGWLHYARADLPGVLEVNHEAMAIYRETGNQAGESIGFNDLGRAYIDMGDVTQAFDAFKQALALRPADRDPRGAANVLIRMSLANNSVSEWQQSLDGLLQARALAQRAHDVRTETAAVTNLGSTYVTFGETAEGVRYLQSALAQARSIKFRGAEAYSLLWLAMAALQDGELERSREYLQQAVAIQASINDVRGQTLSWRQLALVSLRLGSPQEALAAINKSIEMAPRTTGLIYSGTLTLANVYAALGDNAKAQALYEEVIAHLRDVRARQAEALALTPYARFQAGQGRYAEARELLEQALTIHESLRGLIVDPDLRMSYTSASLGPYQLYIDVLMELDRRSPGSGLAAQAFHTNERARARSLLDILATSGIDIREGVDRALIERERALRWNLNAKAAIQTTLLAGKGDQRRLKALDTEITDLSREWRETTTLIRQQSPGYASLTEPQPLTTDDVSKLLGPDTVLLEFASGDAHSWLFALTEHSFESFALPDATAIDDAAREVHRLLTARQPVRDETPAARYSRITRADVELGDRSRALSDLVFGPIANKLANEWRGKRLAIVATGALEYVPFAALPLPGAQARTPLIAAHEIVTLPSASSLSLLRREHATRPAGRKLIAVVADPVFGPDDPRVKKIARAERPAASPAASSLAMRAFETRAIEAFLDEPPKDANAKESDDGGGDITRASLARLPFTRAEAMAVASQVPPAARLQATDFDASLALATSGRLSNYRIVHFATHGLINTKRPELSGLALSLVDAEGRARDGFLRLNTIYNLNLPADLVVLSACQTALGKQVASEGFVGLTRGFMYAGARRVIASLWQVSDVATAELMKKFYAGMLQRHLPAAAALRRAQREMARDPRWSAPYFWAGFVLQGDWQQ